MTIMLTLIYEISMMRPACQDFYVIPLQSFELLRWLIYEGINCYLFIFKIFEKCDIPLGDYSDLFKKFLCWENGVLQVTPLTEIKLHPNKT